MTNTPDLIKRLETLIRMFSSNGIEGPAHGYRQVFSDAITKLTALEKRTRGHLAELKDYASDVVALRDEAAALTAENEALTKELKMVNRLLEEALNSKHAYQQQLKTALSNVEQAESLMRTASDDATRLGTENQKLSLDLNCLEESTVDSKAYESLTKQLEQANDKYIRFAAQQFHRLKAVESQLEQHQWHLVGVFIEHHGVAFDDDADYPHEGRWILVEIESATGIEYEARQYDSRSWPGFGTRWKYCSPPEQVSE